MIFKIVINSFTNFMGNIINVVFPRKIVLAMINSRYLINSLDSNSLDLNSLN